MPALAPYATVYAPDMLGAGFSDRPAGIDHSMRGTAQRVLRFIAGLGITSFDLLGTSHGGAVAMFAAAQCLDGNSRLRLRRMVLVDPVIRTLRMGDESRHFSAAVLGLGCSGRPLRVRVFVSVLAFANVWRPETHSSGCAGGVHGSAGQARIV